MQCVLFSHVNISYGIGRYAGIYRIATELRSLGLETVVIDFWTHFSDHELDKLLKKFITSDTILVGFSNTLIGDHTDSDKLKDLYTTYSRETNTATFWSHMFHKNNEYMENLFNYIKTLNPNVKIVIGGRKLDVMKPNLKGVDAWFFAESDLTIKEYVTSLINKTPVKTYYRPDPSFEFNTSKIIWHKNDIISYGEHLPIEIARGCIFNCKFCFFTKKKKNEYVKSLETLREELEYNFENFGVTSYMVSDDTFNDTFDKVKEMHDLFKSLSFKINFSAYMRPDMFIKYSDMIPMIKDMGCRSVFFGVETMNPESAKTIGKANPEKVVKVIENCRNYWKDDVFIAAGIIVGLPYDTKETINDMFNYLVSDQSPFHSWNVNTLALRKNLTNIGNSIFSDNPEKYGYKFSDGVKNWYNSEFTYESARQFTDQFIKSENSLKKNKPFTMYNYYDRMCNAGFTHDELKNMTLIDSWWYNRLRENEKQFMNNYYNKLINL